MICHKVPLVGSGSAGDDQSTSTSTPPAQPMPTPAAATGQPQGTSPHNYQHVHRPLPDFAFGKHIPETINRVVTEIAGAPFVSRLAAAASAAKRKHQQQACADAQGESQAQAVDINTLLTVQPKKRARRAAPKSKRAATPKTTAAPDADDVELVQDIVMGFDAAAGDDSTSRARWWVDDVFACLAHAAGGSLVRRHLHACGLVMCDVVMYVMGCDVIEFVGLTLGHHHSAHGSCCESPWATATVGHHRTIGFMTRLSCDASRLSCHPLVHHASRVEFNVLGC